MINYLRRMKMTNYCHGNAHAQGFWILRCDYSLGLHPTELILTLHMDLRIKFPKPLKMLCGVHWETTYIYSGSILLGSSITTWTGSTSEIIMILITVISSPWKLKESDIFLMKSREKWPSTDKNILIYFATEISVFGSTRVLIYW